MACAIESMWYLSIPIKFTEGLQNVFVSFENNYDPISKKASEVDVDKFINWNIVIINDVLLHYVFYYSSQKSGKYQYEIDYHITSMMFELNIEVIVVKVKVSKDY